MSSTPFGQRAIQKTDDDAAEAKLAAVSKKYYEDEYLPFFCKKHALKLPLINIGTYCRVKGLEILIEEFLASNKDRSCQIVSVGAGSDTRPLHLLPRYPKLKYVEIDFRDKAQKKSEVLRAKQLLKNVETPADPKSPCVLRNANYELYGIDLRDIRALKFQDIATLVLSECCLCYMALDDSTNVLKYFREVLKELTIALYEPMSLHDKFGEMMEENLGRRGLYLPSVDVIGTLDAQKRRLQALGGFADVGAVNLWEVYQTWLTTEDRIRSSRLELLDEIEELRLLLSHYCIAWAR